MVVLLRSMHTAKGGLQDIIEKAAVVLKCVAEIAIRCPALLERHTLAAAAGALDSLPHNHNDLNRFAPPAHYDDADVTGRRGRGIPSLEVYDVQPAWDSDQENDDNADDQEHAGNTDDQKHAGDTDDQEHADNNDAPTRNQHAAKPARSAASDTGDISDSLDSSEDEQTTRTSKRLKTASEPKPAESIQFRACLDFVPHLLAQASEALSEAPTMCTICGGTSETRVDFNVSGTTHGQSGSGSTCDRCAALVCENIVKLLAGDDKLGELGAAGFSGPWRAKHRAEEYDVLGDGTTCVGKVDTLSSSGWEERLADVHVPKGGDDVKMILALFYAGTVLWSLKVFAASKVACDLVEWPALARVVEHVVTFGGSKELEQQHGATDGGEDGLHLVGFEFTDDHGACKGRLDSNDSMPCVLLLAKAASAAKVAAAAAGKWKSNEAKLTKAFAGHSSSRMAVYGLAGCFIPALLRD